MPSSRKSARGAARAKQAVLVLNGPNLNVLGTREPDIYGRETLADVVRRLKTAAAPRGARFDTFQSNREGGLIDRIQAAKKQQIAFIIVNPGGFTHSSVALRVALAAVAIPFIEVHLSNIHSREPFRRHSYFSGASVGTICGLGSRDYHFALAYALDR